MDFSGSGMNCDDNMQFQILLQAEIRTEQSSNWPAHRFYTDITVSFSGMWVFYQKHCTGTTSRGDEDNSM